MSVSIKNSTYCKIIYFVVKILLVITYTIQTLHAEEECLKKAWQALNSEKYEEAIRFADQCIKNFANQADKRQSDLEANHEPEPLVGEIDVATKTKILDWGALNDVETAYFIQGRSFEELYFQGEDQNVEYKRMAEKMYKASCRYTYARTWDTQKGIWSPCEASKERLEGKLLYDGSIWSAADDGDLASVKQLIEIENVDVNIKAPDGWTPLHYAAQHGHLEIVKYLIQKGAYVDSRQQQGATPLIIAANNFYQFPNGNLDVIKYLVENNANVNVKIESGQNILDLAIPETTPEVVKYLIQKGVNTGVEEHTLRMADLSRKEEVIRLLFEHNARVNTTEYERETTLMLAVELGYIDIVELLLEQRKNGNTTTDDNLISFYLVVEQHLIDKDKPYTRTFLNNVGIVYNHLEQHQWALESYKQALTINRELNDRKREEMNLLNIGNAYSDLRQYQQALESYKQALSINREIDDRRGEGSTLNNLGMVYWNLRHYERALESYKQALSIKQEIGDRGGEVDVLNKIGLVYQNIGQYHQALAYYDQALMIARKFNDREGESFVLNNLGVVYNYLGQYKQALESYEQNLRIDRELGDRQGEAKVLGNLGIVYGTKGEFQRSIAYLELALTINREFGEKLEEGHNLISLGVGYGALGQFQRALVCYEQALTITRELGDREGEGAVLSNLGELYKDMKEYKKASKSFQNSLTIFQALGNPEMLWGIQSSLASVEVKLNQPEAAITHYEKALEAIEQLRTGLTEKEHKLSFMQNKLFIYDDLFDLLQDLHRQYLEKGYDRKALEIFERRQGRIFLEEMGKSGARLFAGIPEDVTQRELDLSIQREQTRKQLANERSKPITEQNKEQIKKIEEQEKTLITNQQALQERIKTKYPDYYILKYPKPVTLNDLQQNVLQPGELLLIYSVMKDHTILWTISQNQFRLIPIDLSEIDLQKAIETFRSPPNAIIDAVNNKQSLKAIQLANETVDDIAQQGYALYQQLFPEAVSPLLAEAQTLYIVPTGPLYGLPFEALVTEAPETGERPHYLIQDHPITYLSSASLLKILRDAQARRKQTTKYPLLAFANPVYESTPTPSQEVIVSLQEMRSQSYLKLLGGSQFPPLPETQAQVEALAKILEAPNESDPLQLGEHASRATVFVFNVLKRLVDYQYLVFATHGVLPGEVDYIQQPALVLSYPEKDGYLTMADVFSLKLNAKLVALSACNTGRGEQIRGEGIMGLTRAFMYAGTPAVAVTLWSVDSKASYEINTRFFQYLKDGKSLAKALRQAKLDLLAEAAEDEDLEHFRHPFFWAPFVVFGDGR